MPIFTTFWCRHYTALGRALGSEAGRPTPARIRSRAKIGAWAGIVGSLLSILPLFGAVCAVLVTLLGNPQVGLQISAAETGASPDTISAIDAVSVVTLLLALTAELLVVATPLRLVFLVAWASSEGAET